MSGRSGSDRFQPIAIGDSLAHSRATAGTLGCFAAGTYSGAPVLLSASSVLAPPGAQTGDYIYSPAPSDSVQPSPRSRIAILGSYDREIGTPIPLPHVQRGGNVFLTEAVPPEFRGMIIRTVLPVAQAVPGLQVAKLGRTTGFTRGRLAGTETAVEVSSDAHGKVWVEGQIVILAEEQSAFAGPGDAGALVVSIDPWAALGLIIAAGPAGQPVIVSPLEAVLSRFGLVLNV